MRYDYLPERWKTKLKEYLTAKGQIEQGVLIALDFSASSTVRIRFEDE
ncbi:MAG TPA: hypothetical protein VF690_09485 [Hymenobacter sp.]|jgi:hypothetical protein